MTYGIDAHFDTLRELLSASIANAYTAVGTPLTHEARMVQVNNSTDRALYISLDAATNIMRVPAGVTQNIEFCSNKVKDDGFFLPVGTQFYVNRTEAGATSSGSISIQVIYSSPTP